MFAGGRCSVGGAVRFQKNTGLQPFNPTLKIVDTPCRGATSSRWPRGMCCAGHRAKNSSKSTTSSTSASRSYHLNPEAEPSYHITSLRCFAVQLLHNCHLCQVPHYPFRRLPPPRHQPQGFDPYPRITSFTLRHFWYHFGWRRPMSPKNTASSKICIMPEPGIMQKQMCLR